MLVLMPALTFADVQKGVLTGKVVDKITKEPLPGFRTSFGELLSIASLNTFKNYYKYGFYAQYSDVFLDRLMVSLGTRGD